MSHRSFPPPYFNPPRVSPVWFPLMRARKELSPPPAWIEPRGVYWARHRIDGRRLAYAVDSRGERVKTVRVRSVAYEARAIAYLWDYLDALDPETRWPVLELVS